MGTKSKFRTLAQAGLFATAVFSAGCLAADPRERYASVVETYLETPFVGSDAVYADPNRALGPPDGRTVALGQGAVLTLRFFREIPNGLGPDFRVIEIGDDEAQARVAVSDDGETFYEFSAPASAANATDYDLDDASLSKVRSIRIRGMDNQGMDPGFDLDAIEALN